MNNWAYPNSRNGVHLATVANGTYKGEVAYCIEFGKTMGDDGQEETVTDIEDVPVWSDFNSTQKNGITRATIYGYPNFDYGVSDEAAQVATQFIVWEYSQGYRTSADGDNPTAGLDGTSSKIESSIEAAGFDVRQQYYSSGVVPYDDVMTAYVGILNAIKNHKTVPSFKGDTVELEWNKTNNRYEATLTDSNKILSYFKMTSGNSDLKFSTSGNKLTVYTSSTLDSTVSVTMTKTCTTVGADVGFVPDDQDYNQSLVGRLTDPVTATFKVKTASGNAQIVKTSEDGTVEGINFTITGNGLTYTGTTDSSGKILFENIPAGTYTVTEESIEKYAAQNTQTVTVSNGETATVSFSNVLKKFRVTVTKTDIETTTAQGDASLAGAVYGIYDGDTLVDTYETDANGCFTTDYYVCGDNWTVREITASEGYLLDTSVHKVGAQAKLYTVEYNETDNDVQEQVIKGNVSIIKHTDTGETQIETPESGATFQIYLKSAGSYEKASDTEKDTIVCDDDGYASSKLLPYGVYTVHQTVGWDGREMISDFDVYIQSDGVTYKYLINNANFYSYLKIVKADSETGKQIAYEGAGFEIYDSDGHRVTMQYTYPEVTSIHTFYTNSEGYLITPEKLAYGDYTLVEVQAPYGYVLDSTPIEFSITQENSSTDTGVTVVKVTAKDTAQKGIIEITKTGEKLSSVNENDSIYTPVYESANLADAVFQIYAAEDITTLDGTLRYYQGELVDEVTTSSDGTAKSKELYLGKYTVIEKTAPNGYVNANEQYDIELTYAGQEVSVTSTALSVNNERQKVSVSLKKILEQDETFGIGMNDEILSVEFGIYADEDIEASDKTVILKDSLITCGYCDENGEITFNCDLPIGFKFYVREISTNEQYILSDTKYEFDTEYQGQDIETITVDLNGGEEIVNDLIYGTVKGLKTDRETGKAIEGALFGLFNANETEYTKGNAVLTATSDEDGIFVFENVPFGEWTVKELEPTENYLSSDDIYHITITENEQVIEINAVNDKIPELKTTADVDGEKEICATEVFTLTDTVEYQHLIENKEYTLKGVLMDKTTGKELVINGETITSETTFIPTEPSGETTVEFTFDSKYIKTDTDIVVFESLYKGGKELAVHADIDDESQTVTVKVPEIKTTADINGEKEATASGEITITDTVSYTNLTPNVEYTIIGTLTDKSTGKSFEIDGEAVTSKVTFTPEKSNGEVTVSFTFDSSVITEDTDLVVFETLYRDDTEIASHSDIDDEDQTVKMCVPVTVTTSNPKTGDERNYGFWIGIGAVGLGCALSAVILKIKAKKDEGNC